MSEEEKAKRVQDIRNQKDNPRFGRNVLPLKLEPAPPIEVNEESYSDSSDSESDEREKSFQPPTQGEKVEGCSPGD